jgi:PPOX class probable F420-dependent enzyme
MDLSRALQLATGNKVGVLATLRQDGRPQLSNVMYAATNGVVRISVTNGRAKTANLRRDPRASLYVGREDGWAYLVIEGEAELSAVAAAADDAVVDELVELYRALQGEHPDWDEYRRAMTEERRMVVRLHPARAYGMWAQAETTD